MSLSGAEVGLWKAFGSVGPLQPQPAQVAAAAAACPAAFAAAVQISSPPASAAAFEAVPGWCFDRTVIVVV